MADDNDNDLNAIPIDQLIPGGIRPTDCRHPVTDRTCSRCQRRCRDGSAPLMLWGFGENMLMYCEDCLQPPPCQHPRTYRACGRGSRQIASGWYCLDCGARLPNRS
jgi:hypothetical protein